MAAPAPEPRLRPELVAFLHGPVAGAIATRDAELRPALARAWGVSVTDDGATLEVLAVAPAGSALRRNLEARHSVALTFSPPTIARALQVKGTPTVVADPSPEQAARAARHFDAFLAEACSLGYPVEIIRRLEPEGELLAVRLTVEAVFDQTPGPRAGARV